ncbi:DUF6695 family protein [Flavobacterium caseinilyticum]|uniref:Uncharacterized protein n=1 Tax=Flavobacterium caseinilyticum TaxID=2541732 RepID=A0A4V2YTU8_9FLAO|nr:DUF6695 family protein [Flavobacterium caseinilyticum]TDD75227.1 hypothetical protein E0F89_12660 [Flavobacterium caseinilyticum]
MSNFNGMAIAIAWPEFNGKQPGSWYDTPMRWIGHNKNFQYKVGHASLILVDAVSGHCSYFDCGRYHAPFQHGRIRDVATDSNLEIRTKANFADNKIANIKEILNEVQNNKTTYGAGPLYASYCAVNIDSSRSKIKQLQSKDAIPFGPFVLNGINCCRFVRNGILAGTPALKYRFKLRYLWPLKPMPITNVDFLSGKITIPKNSVTNSTEKQQYHSTSYSKENVKNTLPAPTRPENIPQDSQWLSGEVAGSWFWLQPMNQGYLINRYSSEGSQECTGKFRVVNIGCFNSKRPYFFSHLSHCSKVTILQDDELFEFLKEE